MIPLRDNIPHRHFPFVNYAIIAFTTFVLLGQLFGPPQLVERYGMIPARMVQPDEPVRMPEHQRPDGTVIQPAREAAEPPIHPWFTIATSIFLHGGLLHFLINMWFLHIFGDNVEDRLGHVGFLIFYLACGVLAALAQLAAAPSSPVPMVGASGAIAGVMGGYLLLYPRAKVLSLIPVFIIPFIFVLPAPVFLGLWFLLQFVLGMLALGGDTGTGGVAWWAHVGGFVAGFAIVALLLLLDKIQPPVREVRPRTEHSGAYRYRAAQP